MRSVKPKSRTSKDVLYNILNRNQKTGKDKQKIRAYFRRRRRLVVCTTSSLVELITSITPVGCCCPNILANFEITMHTIHHTQTITITCLERELRSSKDDMLLLLTSLIRQYETLNIAMGRSVDTICPCALLPGKRKPSSIAIVTAAMAMITVEIAQQTSKA
jgi:hypothetical protein